jgi:hypothetical protein
MNPTLHGGHKITITFDPAADAAPDAQLRTEDVLVRQVPVGEYNDGFKHYANEVALVAFLINKPLAFVTGDAKTKTPGISGASYEEILAVGREVNDRFFFASCRRRIEAQLETEKRGEIYLEVQRELRIAESFARLPEELRTKMLASIPMALPSGNAPSSSSPPRPG